jgi:signal transduction histidine kinase
MRLSKKNFEFFFSHVKFTWAAFMLYAIASTFSVVLRLADFEPSRHFVSNTVVMGLLITSVTALLLLTGFKIASKIFRENIWALPPMLLLAGAIRGAILYWEIDLMGFENKIALPESMLSSAFYTSIYYAGASFVIEVRIRRAQQFHREFLLATLASLDATQGTSMASPEAEYKAMLTKMRDAISSPGSRDAIDSMESQRIAEIAERVREQIQEVLRPLSHRLWVSAAGEIQTKNSTSLIKEAVEDLDFSALFILMYQIMVGIFGIGLSIGFRSGIIKTIAASVGSYLTIKTYRFAKQHLMLDWRILSSLFLTGMAVLPIFFSEILSYFINVPINLIAATLIAPTLPILVVVTSLYSLVSKDRQLAIAAARVVKNQATDLVSPGNVNLTVKDLAGYIHNNLQADLLRISHRLDQVATQTSEDDPGALLQELEQVLGRSLKDVSNLQFKGVERIKALPHVWRGIAEIELNYQITETLPPERSSLLVGVVEEMVTNSIRHGEATRLSIDIQVVTGGIQVNIIHNGRDRVQGKSGLGSIYLSQVAFSGPSVTRDGGLTNYSLQF